MAAVLNGTRDQVRAAYKVDYDTTGEFPLLGDFAQTFSYVKESASVDVKKAMVDALMSLTVYKDAPYKSYLVSTSEMVVG